MSAHDQLKANGITPTIDAERAYRLGVIHGAHSVEQAQMLAKGAVEVAEFARRNDVDGLIAFANRDADRDAQHAFEVQEARRLGYAQAERELRNQHKPANRGKTSGKTEKPRYN